MTNYMENDYSQIEQQIKDHKEIIITRHFSSRMAERNVYYKDLKPSLLEPKVIRHEGSYDHYGNLRIKYTLQCKDTKHEDIGIVCALAGGSSVILITVMYFWEEIGWERQTDGLYIKK